MTNNVVPLGRARLGREARQMADLVISIVFRFDTDEWGKKWMPSVMATDFQEETQLIAEVLLELHSGAYAAGAATSSRIPRATVLAYALVIRDLAVAYPFVAKDQTEALLRWSNICATALERFHAGRPVTQE